MRKSDFAEIDACTLPESVKNLKVISTGYSTLRLSWDKVTNATGYLIYRQSTTDITKYGLIATVSNGAITSYTDSELPSASEFTYRVVAYREFNEKSILENMQNHLIAHIRIEHLQLKLIHSLLHL